MMNRAMTMMMPTEMGCIQNRTDLSKYFYFVNIIL